MPRRMFKFWLNDSKHEEKAIVGQVDTLKQERLFSKTIRDGIRLVTSLRSGSLDVLFELFPYVRAEFMEYVKSVKSDDDDNDQLKREINELKMLILQQGSKPDTPIMKPSSSGLQPLGGLKPIGSNSVPLPDFEDDDFDLEVTRPVSVGSSAAQNFLASMQALQQ